ncbi:hypothetical protein GCM10027519_42800 [Kineococcus endophyticus]
MSSSRKQPRPRRSFTAEFKAEIVQRCRAGDRSVGQVARDFDLTETAVREWVRAAERDERGDGGPGELSADEREELARLRRENRQLREDVGILKRAIAFFAGCVLIEAHDEWQSGERRYLSESSMTLLTPPEPTVLPTPALRADADTSTTLDTTAELTA